MTIAIQQKSRKKSPDNLADRRRAAYERAQRIRTGEGGLRSRYQDATSRDPKPVGYYVIAAVSIILVLFGLVMVMSSSSIVSFNRGDSAWKLFRRQAFYAGVGAFGMVSAYKLKLDILHKFARIGPFIGLGLMSLAWMPGLGVEVNGARAWIQLFDQRFQPSEFMKLFIVIAGADLLSRRTNQMHDWRLTMKPFGIVVGLGAGLSMIQSDFGSCAVMLGIGFVILFLAGAPLLPMTAVAVGGAALGTIAVLVKPDKFVRITSFFDIYGNRGHETYQVYQSLISLSNGGITGTGIGAGTGKWGYVPLAHSDFIFATLAEEMGFLGVIGLIALFTFLIYFGFQAALSCRTTFGRLLAGGIAGWFLIQICVNIGGVTGVIPVTGLTLPFISFGGSSLIVSMVSAGLLMNVARRPR
ncbi:MAG: FtsW/RodA/SpoVE family cell cycle protein [Ilumatobacteraceae bacterium]|jgi:cell division protein FtsW|nr:cell division protein FtsW [Actinomycetota bacterium]NDA78847.1 cell division protein FtsW [Actinomycetota bacterium]NDB05370.1 cell division protein FtsW [Acidimicrobiia bacterium]NDE58696.1 cell division protein FtsW [Acidimicrobiia bacterium]NDF31114.1 cell division protein FtsW [Acidimicrobiia bacterium]